jgi:hypothetical protein
MVESNRRNDQRREAIVSLGLDLAWASPTGYALVEIFRDDERVIKTGIITVPSGKVTERLQQERAKALFDGLVGILIDSQKGFSLDLIAYESAEEWVLAKARSPYRFHHRTRTNLAALLSLGAAKACLWFASIWAAPHTPLFKYEPNYVRRHFSEGLVVTRTIHEEVAEIHPNLTGVKLANIESVLARTSFLAPTHHEADAVLVAVVAGREFLLGSFSREASKPSKRCI